MLRQSVISSVDAGFWWLVSDFENITCSGFITFLCRRSMGFFTRAFSVFLIEESKKRRWKQLGKLMAKSRSQPVNLPGAWPIMNPLNLWKFLLTNRLIPFHSLWNIGPWELPTISFCFGRAFQSLFKCSLSLMPHYPWLSSSCF